MQNHPNSPGPRATGLLQAETAGGEAVARSRPPFASPEPLDIEKAGQRYIAQRRALGRKKSTLEDYESTLRVHLVPFFGGRTLAEIDVPMVEAFIFAKLEEGKAPKSIKNHLGFLNSILDYAASEVGVTAAP